MEKEIYHIPALLTESIDALNINARGSYVDATFGGGGHSRAILQRLGPTGHLYGFDRDIDALQNAPDDSRFTFVHSDYRFIPNFLHYYGCDKVDGILADLGVSFHHFDSGERGFSFREEAPLDMRMNQKGERTAARIIADASPEKLESIFRAYTDLKRPRLLVNAIVKARSVSPILTTSQLTDALTPALSPKNLKKDLAQAFQALRIETNDELHSLQRLLLNSLSVLKPGGRFAIITYHSIEDRMVKNFFRSGNLEGKVEQDFYGRVLTPWKQITRNPVVPSAEEIERNPRSRSAKLRVAELIDDNN
jgi:16S rRNA (cytosine1402-N4)-methyltransferase